MSDKMKIVFTNGAELVMPKMFDKTNVEDIIAGKIQQGQRGLLRSYGGKRINPMEIAYIDVEYEEPLKYVDFGDAVSGPETVTLVDTPKRGPGRPPTKLKMEVEEVGKE